MLQQRWVYVAVATVACILEAQGADKYTDENRPYEFGFNIDGEQHRHEKKDKNGLIMGEFGFITADGVYHVTVYATDENGNFKILSMKNIRTKPYPTAPGKTATSQTFPGKAGQEKPAQEKKGHSLPFPPSQNPPQTQGPSHQNPPARAPAAPARSCSSCSIPTTTTARPQLTDFAVVSQNQGNNHFGGQTPGSAQYPPGGQNFPGSQGNFPSGQGNFPGSQANNAGSQGHPGSQENRHGDQQNYNRPAGAGPQYSQGGSGPNYKQPGADRNYPQTEDGGLPIYPPLGQEGQQDFPQQGQGGQPNYPQQNQGGPNYPQQNQGVPNYPQQNQGVPNYPQQNQGGQNYPQENQGVPNYPQNHGGPNYPQQNQGGPNYAQQAQGGQQNYPQGADRNPKQFTDYPSGPQGPDGNTPTKPTLISAQMQIVDKNTDIHHKNPGERDGLPDGLTKDEMTRLLYTFNYTVGFHGHFEEGYTNGAKQGYYYVTGRNGVRTRVDYVADEKGFRPKITQEVLDLLSDDVPKPETEKDEKFGLKGYEFKWLYYPVESSGR